MWEGVETQSKSQKKKTNQRIKGKEKRTQNTHIYA